jgi:hypothetical protein
MTLHYGLHDLGAFTTTVKDSSASSANGTLIDADATFDNFDYDDFKSIEQNKFNGRFISVPDFDTSWNHIIIAELSLGGIGISGEALESVT